MNGFEQILQLAKNAGSAYMKPRPGQPGWEEPQPKSFDFAFNASPDQRKGALMDEINYLAEDPAHRISFGGDMAAVNAGGFAGALRPQSVFLPGQTTPAIFRNPAKLNLGQMQQATQNPDLSVYEGAVNSNNWALADKISKLYPGDARFGIHKLLEGMAVLK